MLQLKRKSHVPFLLFCPLQPSHFRFIPGNFNVKPILYGINVPPDDTQKHTTTAETPLKEGSARSIELYLATYNNLQTQTNMTCSPSD
jgi:hypothetical protein